MKILFTNRRLPENIEVLFMLVLGILLQTTDGSPFTIKKKWTIVWETELPSENFSQIVQRCIKSILSGIVVARCLTTYFYVLSGMLVIFSILKDSRPQLMLIWLLVAGIKSIIVTIIETLTGIYVCSAFGKIRKACVEFFLSKSLEIIFSTYLWISVLYIYYDMTRREAELQKPLNWAEYYKQLDFKRPRTRSLLDESVLFKTARLNNFEFKDVPQIILQMLRKEEEMSEDSLLNNGMMLASVSNLGSFDNLQTSQSLGELGLLDLKSVQVTDLEDDENLSPQEKALKFLNLTWNDVKRAQEMKEINPREVFLADDETFKRISKDSGIKKPKQQRPEIVLQQIPNSNSDEGNKLLKKESKKNLVELKWEFSLHRFLQEKQLFRAMEEEQVSSNYTFDDDDEEAEEEGLTPLFMSNIKEELAVHRIRLDYVSKNLKGNNYAKLCKEEYMSVVGPEVFDRASKLPKVISLNLKKETRSTGSVSGMADERRKSKKKLMSSDATPEQTSEKSLCSEEKSSIDVNESKNLDVNEVEAMLSALAKDTTQDTNDAKAINSSVFTRFANSLTYQNKSNVVKDSNNYELENIPLDEENYEQYEPEVENHKKLKAESTSGSFANKSVIKSFSSKSIGQSNRSFDEKCKDHTENKKLGLCYRKRKIAVIRRRKLIRKPVFQIDLSRSFFHKDNGNRSDKEADHVEISRVKDEKKNCDCDQSNCPPGSKSKIKDFPIASKNKEVHYVSQVLRNPFADSLTSNDDFRSQNSERFDTENLEMACHSKAYSSLPAFNTNFSRDFINEKRKEVKVWKSKVLETVANKSWKIKSDPITLRKIKIKYLAKVIENILRKKLTRKRNILMNEIFLNFQKECELNEALMGRKNVLVRRQENFKRYPLTVQKKESITETVQSTSEKINSVQDFSNLKQKHSNSNKFVFEEEAIMEKFKRESSDSQVIRSWVNTAFSDESNVNHLDATSSKASETKIFEDFLEPLDLTMEESLPEFKNRVSRESIKKVDFAPPSNSQNPLENAPCLHDSEESFSLYYSKAADLASPLLDMKRFIYPDHIHYSYKHVKKKGFDVDINGGLPLLVRESLTMNNPINLENVSTLQNPQSGIIRRPMDLSFASTSAEWQNSDHDRSSFQELEIAKDEGMEKAVNKNKSQYFESTAEMKLKSKKWRKNNFREDFPFERKSNCRNSYSFKPFEHDYYLIEKLLKMCKKINNEKPVSSFDELDNERPPVQISSTQLHSNKGRINSTYNPAIFLNENKTRSERRKAETQEERTKDMFARLEREILLQSKNLHKDFGPSQNS